MTRSAFTDGRSCQATKVHYKAGGRTRPRAPRNAIILKAVIKARNYVQQLDIVWSIYRISGQLSIYPVEMSGEKQKTTNEDNSDSCGASKT